MKQLYESPEMELIKFDTQDIITTSGEEGDIPGYEGIGGDVDWG